MKRGQTWSLELAVTIMIFLFALVVFGGMVLKKGNNVGGLSSDAEKIMAELSSSSDNSILENNNLDKNKTLSMNYTELSRSLGLKNDVCIYFEDKNGRIINISGKTAIGDSSITINGQQCSDDS